MPKCALEAGGTVVVTTGKYASLVHTYMVTCSIKNLSLYSHLTGTYGSNDFAMGVNWYHFRGDEYSLKRAVMMIRPRK